jgi:hypothetical protein
MNGRVYDPLVARFMSADPYIQDAYNSQSFNRYTYVWNNPTNLTDPDGFKADTGDEANGGGEGSHGSASDSTSHETSGSSQEVRSPTKDQSGVGIAASTAVPVVGSKAMSNFLRWLDDQILRGLAEGRSREQILRNVGKPRVDYATPVMDKLIQNSFKYSPSGSLLRLTVTIAVAMGNDASDADAKRDSESLSNDTNSGEGAKDGAKTGDNTNPYKGPVDQPVVVVDQYGNAIPVKPGEQVKGSPNGDYQQVLGPDGKPTGDRLDRGGHKQQPDPRAQGPHGHRTGVTTPDGNPHLPIYR